MNDRSDRYNFAQYVVDKDVPPKICHYCVFHTYDLVEGEQCELLDELIYALNEPMCEMHDFIKYLMERL